MDKESEKKMEKDKTYQDSIYTLGPSISFFHIISIIWQQEKSSVGFMNNQLL